MKKITEKSLQEEIMWQLKAKGWLVLRLPPSIYSSKGLPDLLAIKGKQYLLVEVKSPTGKLSKTQQIFQMLMKEFRGNYVVAKSYEDVEVFIRKINETKKSNKFS